MQSISIAHDLSDHQHEASEVCEILSAFGANKAIVSLDAVNLDVSQNSSQVKVVSSLLIDRPFTFVHRSRSPPLLSVS